jgi:hypothetical protein
MKLKVILFFFLLKSTISLNLFDLSDILGRVCSAISLALAIPHYIIWKRHLRILDFIQILNPVILYIGNMAVLGWGWLEFIPSFWNHSSYDGTVKYSKYAGSILSFTICLIVTIFNLDHSV